MARHYTVVIVYQHNGNKAYHRDATVDVVASSVGAAASKAMAKARRNKMLVKYRQKEGVSVVLNITPGPKAGADPVPDQHRPCPHGGSDEEVPL
jgi:hypothetical protein